ncbi:Type I Iterative PKS [Paecilomyces lecythidis]|uniref:Type I Iterative PKS n=1 Tax=Paecilomyces lecythidis TaxID=3004212 RepID=A0ABR3YD84_9EURO
MRVTNRVYLFGDQTGEFETGLRQLLQAKNNSLLTSFFERCFYVLRQEISKLPPSQRQIFPRFTSVVDLLARYRECGPNPALESALTCIYHFACFINHYGDGGHIYPSASESHILGLCTGLLASAAVGSSRTVGELIPAAVETVVVSLRLGLCVLRARDLVDHSNEKSQSWSLVVSGLNEEKAAALLGEFCQRKFLAPSSRPYVSAVNSHSLTISAPPSILQEFANSCLSKENRPVKVSIHAPYHAPHLYDQQDVCRILESWPKGDFMDYTPRIPILSSETGEILLARNLHDLLGIALEEILLRKLCWDRVQDGCASVLKQASCTSCRIFPIASTASQGLSATLKRAGLPDVEVDNTINESAKTCDQRNSSGRSEQSKIAIIGLSGRFPDAPSPEHFWDLLYKGLDVHRLVPPDRWDVKAHVDPTGKIRNTSKVPYGCWIEEPGLFDPRFFNMSPREALQADPAQRLALVTAYEALEQAGFVPDSSPSTQKDRVGIFYGMTSDDYREVNSGQDIDTYFIPGGNRAFTPGRINYHFKFSGPSVSVDTACSSSLAAIHLACNSLWRNDCDTAIAGGTNVLTNPDNFAGLDRGHFLSAKGNCNTFDDEADGYCRADAVGTVVLKRLEDAQADKDPILGVILGAYTNHSAEAVSMTRPHVGAQAFIFNKLLNEANVSPRDVSYIEMHGTGTQAGDAVEMKSVLDIFAPDYTRGPNQSLYLGSTKANIGHAESASGVSSLIKVLLMLQQNTIPPHCGIKTKINHNFPTDFKERNVHIAFKPTSWERPHDSKRKLFVNNFSAAGGNTALLIEDAPLPTVLDAPDPRSTHIVAVSARSQSSLRNNIRSLLRYVNEVDGQIGGDNLLGKLSYTTTARRIHHQFRTIVSASSLQGIKDALSSAACRESFTAVPALTPSTGFVFTGQGAQYAGMGQQLYASYSQFRDNIERFDSIARSQGFPSIIPLIDGSVPIEDMSPVVTQLGTTCLQMAMARFWMSLGVKPAFVLGHSLGNYAALNVAGVLTTSDTIYLSGRRAQLLEEKCQVGTHSMLAIKASLAQIRPFLDDGAYEVACINAPGETVISGLSVDVDILSEKLTTEGLKSTKLRVPYAFHSTQVEPILESLGEVAQGVTFHKPSVPIISALLGEVINEDNSDVLGPNYLQRHCRETVNFLAALEATRHAKLTNDKTIWIEIGSHTVCSGMIKGTLGPQTNTIASLRRNEDTWKVLCNSLSAVYLAGVEIQWKEYHVDFTSSQQVLQLPAYNWDNKNYYIPYNNNFCLTKGDPTVAKIEAAPFSQYHTTSVQRIIETRNEGSRATVIMESDISDPLLNPVIQGHKVNGAALCPSSLYADIAQTLGEYLIENHNPTLRGSGLDVCDMTVPKPLIAKNSGPQLFRATATADWEERKAIVQIYSVKPDGKKIMDHASCLVKFSDSRLWEADWKRHSYLIKRSIERLHKSVEEGQSHRMHRRMFYKLFGALVDYGDNYKSVEEVILDSEEYEATARVKFQAESGNFHRNPFWIDSIGHLTGFVMNANDATDSQNQVYVNHGWDFMRCVKKFSPDTTYRTYVKMQPWQGTIYSGDVYAFEGDEIVAVYGGVKFQGVPRQVLNTVLPPAGGSKTTPRTTTRAAPPPPINVEKKSSVETKVVPKSVPSNPIKAAGPSVLVRALKILAEEIGVSESELSDELVFADYGVDSLLALTITGRFREDLNMDLESSTFIDNPTVKDLKQLLSQASPSDSSDSSDESHFSFRDSSSTEPSTPGTPAFFSPKRGSVANHAGESEIMKTIRLTLSEEIGVSPEEITGDSNLGEMGMDSLLSLTVLGRLRESLDLDLPGDFFIENQTMDDVEVALDLKPKAGPTPSKPAESTQTSTSDEINRAFETRFTHPPASSILLQGNPKVATKTLFLFPDGSGSATSYATIPAVSSDVCVYGLNCPYMRNPENLKCSLDELTKPYVAEIRRRQPKGPYNFGGWSAGGICAYDAARYLILEEGEKVERLLLLDSPFPIGLEKLPPRLYGFFDSIGLFGEGKTPPPKWLLPHFLAFIDSLDAYDAIPFPFSDPKLRKHMPKTYLIWAKDGVCGKPGDPRPDPPTDGSKDPREMLWLLNDRIDMGPNGWDTLVGPDNVAAIEAIEGANHFTMMKGDKGAQLSTFIGKAMAK